VGVTRKTIVGRDQGKNRKARAARPDQAQRATKSTARGTGDEHAARERRCHTWRVPALTRAPRWAAQHGRRSERSTEGSPAHTIEGGATSNRTAQLTAVWRPHGGCPPKLRKPGRRGWWHVGTSRLGAWPGNAVELTHGPLAEPVGYCSPLADVRSSVLHKRLGTRPALDKYVFSRLKKTGHDVVQPRHAPRVERLVCDAVAGTRLPASPVGGHAAGWLDGPQRCSCCSRRFGRLNMGACASFALFLAFRLDWPLLVRHGRLPPSGASQRTLPLNVPDLPSP